MEQFILISSIGADKNSRAFYMRTKGEVEEAVSKLPFRSVQIFRPSIISGDRGQFRGRETLAVAALKMFSFALVGHLRRYRAVEATTIAAAMISVAKRQNSGIAIHESERIPFLGQK
jgi:uncharacterized protein YbjT (DUF2867 family)